MIDDAYSFRLKRRVTLLTDEEFTPIGDALTQRLQQIMDYRKAHGATIGEARENTSRRALDLYKDLTGLQLDDPDQLYAVRQTSYGRLRP